MEGSGQAEGPPQFDHGRRRTDLGSRYTDGEGMTTVMSVPDRLAKLAELYRSRNTEYGAAYKHFGNVLIGLFPDGLTLKTAEDFNRFTIFTHAMGKMVRYSRAFLKGGHPDSLD